MSKPGRDKEPADRNEVILCGRVSMAAVERTLPSGDVVLTTRVVVDRNMTPRSRASSAGSPARRRVDAIDCVAWTARVQRSVRAWQPGDWVHVEGALRRRFFRTDGGPVGRFEVEITQARRLAASS
jgi:single-strand DNA-binding protein